MEEAEKKVEQPKIEGGVLDPKIQEILRKREIDREKRIERAKVNAKCEYCGKSFEYRVAYFNHLRRTHTNDYYRDHPTEKYIKVGRPSAEEKEEKPIIGKQNEEQQEYKEEEAFPFINAQKSQIKFSKPLTLMPRDAYITQLLIEKGFGKDLGDVQRRALQIAYALTNTKDAIDMYKNVQNDGKKSTSELLDEIKRRKLEQLEIEQLEKEIRGQSIQEQQGGKKMDIGEAIMLMTVMNQNRPQQTEGNTFKQAMELMQFINSQQKQPNTMELIQAMQTMNQPKNNSNESQLEILKFMLENQKGNTNMTEIISFLKDKSKNDAENMLAMQKVNHERMLDKLQNKVEQLQKQFETTPKSEWDPEIMTQKLESIKKLSDVIRGETSGEKNQPNALEFIKGIGETVTPAIQEALKVKQLNIQKEMQQNAMMQQTRPTAMYYDQNDLSEEEAENMSEEEVMDHYRKKEQPKQHIIIKPNLQKQIRNPTSQSSENLYKRGDVKDEIGNLIPSTRIELPGTSYEPKTNQQRQQ